VAQIIQGCIRRQCCFSCIPDTLVFLLWIPDFAPGPRTGPEMSVDFDQTVADFFIKKNLYLSLACAREKRYSRYFNKIKYNNKVNKSAKYESVKAIHPAKYESGAKSGEAATFWRLFPNLQTTYARHGL
jgi:hypothetical protein